MSVFSSRSKVCLLYGLHDGVLDRLLEAHQTLNVTLLVVALHRTAEHELEQPTELPCILALR